MATIWWERITVITLAYNAYRVSCMSMEHQMSWEAPAEDMTRRTDWSSPAAAACCGMVAAADGAGDTLDVCVCCATTCDMAALAALRSACWRNWSSSMPMLLKPLSCCKVRECNCDATARSQTLASSSNRSPRKKAQPYSTPLNMSAMPQNTIHQQSLSSSYAKHHPKPVLRET